MTRVTLLLQFPPVSLASCASPLLSSSGPAPNENRFLIKGRVCGVKVEEIEEPLMREIRYLDKLVDELAKGRPMDAILRSESVSRKGL